MRTFYGGIALVVFGVLLLFDNLGYADIGDILSDYWPLILIALGASILARRTSEERAKETAGAPPGDLVHASRLLGDVRLRVGSRSFRGGSVSTFLGDAHIDLSAAGIGEGSHELRVHCVFGNSTIVVPHGMPYSVTANATFGALDLPGVRRSGFANRAHVASEAFGTTHGRLTIMVDHLAGDGCRRAHDPAYRRRQRLGTLGQPRANRRRRLR